MENPRLEKIERWTKRRLKNICHLALVAYITFDFFLVGASGSDVAFLALTILIEVGL